MSFLPFVPRKDSSGWEEEKQGGKKEREADNDGFLRKGHEPSSWGMGKTLHRTKTGGTWTLLPGQSQRMASILKRKNYGYLLCLGHPGLTKSPGPHGYKSRRVIVVFPGVMGKWQEEARELKGRQMGLKGLLKH